MIRYLTHNEIDKTKWDECISQSMNVLLYGYSWYLDVAARGWDALVLGDYDAVFPLPHRKKFSFRYIYQPLFTQQLGLFYKNLSGASHLAEFISAIPKKFRYIDIKLNEGNIIEGLEHPLVKRRNYLLELDKPYEKIYRNYSESAKRNLGKAKKYRHKILPAGYLEVIKAYVQYKGPQTAKVTPRDYRRFRYIIRAINRNCVIKSVGICNDRNILVAGGIFALCNGRLTYLMGVSTWEGRENRAMYLLFDHIISHQYDFFTYFSISFQVFLLMPLSRKRTVPTSNDTE